MKIKERLNKIDAIQKELEDQRLLLKESCRMVSIEILEQFWENRRFHPEWEGYPKKIFYGYVFQYKPLELKLWVTTSGKLMIFTDEYRIIDITKNPSKIIYKWVDSVVSSGKDDEDGYFAYKENIPNAVNMICKGETE